MVTERQSIRLPSRLDPFLLAAPLPSVADDVIGLGPPGSAAGKSGSSQSSRSSISCPITMADPVEPTARPPVEEP